MKMENSASEVHAGCLRGPPSPAAPGACEFLCEIFCSVNKISAFAITHAENGEE